MLIPILSTEVSEILHNLHILVTAVKNNSIRFVNFVF